MILIIGKNLVLIITIQQADGKKQMKNQSTENNVMNVKQSNNEEKMATSSEVAISLY